MKTVKIRPTISQQIVLSDLGAKESVFPKLSVTTSVGNVSIEDVRSLKSASDDSASDPINLSSVLAQLTHIIGLKN